ncbi:MAG: hypothetical protein WA738_12415, partial [Candidatus Angelobacter sp.]
HTTSPAFLCLSSDLFLVFFLGADLSVVLLGYVSKAKAIEWFQYAVLGSILAFLSVYLQLRRRVRGANIAIKQIGWDWISTSWRNSLLGVAR